MNIRGMGCALYIRRALSIHQKECRKSLGCALSTGKYGNIQTYENIWDVCVNCNAMLYLHYWLLIYKSLYCHTVSYLPWLETPYLVSGTFQSNVYSNMSNTQNETELIFSTQNCSLSHFWAKFKRTQQPTTNILYSQ
jgi:hypothetical protein